jgi:hypothetical protein
MLQTGPSACVFIFISLPKMGGDKSKVQRAFYQIDVAAPNKTNPAAAAAAICFPLMVSAALSCN